MTADDWVTVFSVVGGGLLTLWLWDTCRAVRKRWNQ